MWRTVTSRSSRAIETPPPLRAAFSHRSGRPVQGRANLEANEVRGGRPLAGVRFGAAVHDLDRLLEHRIGPQVADEIGEPDERGSAPLDGEKRTFLPEGNFTE